MTAWTLTSNISRSDALARLPRDEHERSAAWAALEQALNVLDATPVPAWDAVPPDIREHWNLFVEDLARDVPDFAETTAERLHDALVERGYRSDEVAAIRDSFIETVAARTAYDAARWLAGPGASPDAETRARIASLARAHEPALPSWLAEDLAALT